MIYSQIENDTLVVNNASVTNGATSQANIDRKGANYATIRVLLSNIAQATIASADGVTVKLQETDSTAYTNATATTIYASIAGFTDQTGIKFGRELRYEVDLRGRKRYLRLSVIPGTSGVTNEPVTATVISTLSRLEQAQGSTSPMVAGTNDTVTIG